ncbi:superoxide dismutase-like [Cu-Zn] isoform X2 [Leptotrombidium deliense]|uniref:Superoxide dismutase [Cu-Zn] n=1 Tax=Leptotrombidium deliense TaxID=299467 RepID=A0A443RZE7_9ACAR|nr:superoxide dismutase-like [Cu-Zn] isoform X2 [Leptotrombidium deliense]
MLLSFLLCLLPLLITADAHPARCLCTADISNGTIKGTVTFYDFWREDKFRVEGIIYGLTPGYHGFHIHENSDLSNACANAGGHYNPSKEKHGCAYSKQRHAGDLGSIYANRVGVATFKKDLSGQLHYPHKICERSIVVHAHEDDCGKGGHDDSLTSGHSGKRIACATVRLQKCN